MTHQFLQQNSNSSDYTQWKDGEIGDLLNICGIDSSKIGRNLPKFIIFFYLKFFFYYCGKTTAQEMDVDMVGVLRTDVCSY